MKGKLVYKKISWTMQTARWALQKLDFITIYKQTTMQKWIKASTMPANKTQTYHKVHNLKQQTIVYDSNLSIKIDSELYYM